MKYQKGSRVEVLRSRERDKECWRMGELISGNGRFYIVRFDGFACCGGSQLVQGVRPGSIRPCPPVVKGCKLSRGDIVEVLVDFCWQSAKVSKVMRSRYVWVMTFGACEKIRVKKSEVRIKQSWLNDEWVANVQRPHTSARRKNTSTLKMLCESEIMQTKVQNNLNCSDDEAGAKKTNNRTHRSRLKRKSLCGDNPEPRCESKRKSRAVEKDGLIVRAPTVTKSPMAVDPVIRYISSQTQEQPWTYSFWRKLCFSMANDVKESSCHTDTSTTMSSVGSCSVTSHGIHGVCYHTHKPECSPEYNGYGTDAESFYRHSSGEINALHSTEKTVRAEEQRCKAVSSFVHPCNWFLKVILVFAAYALLSMK